MIAKASSATSRCSPSWLVGLKAGAEPLSGFPLFRELAVGREISPRSASQLALGILLKQAHADVVTRQNIDRVCPGCEQQTRGMLEDPKRYGNKLAFWRTRCDGTGADRVEVDMQTGRYLLRSAKRLRSLAKKKRRTVEWAKARLYSPRTSAGERRDSVKALKGCARAGAAELLCRIARGKDAKLATITPASVRRKAVRVLASCKSSPRALDTLVSLAQHDRAPRVRQAAIEALAAIGSAKARPALLSIAAQDSAPMAVRHAARIALRRLNRKRAAR
jgi:hypothetical protein